MKDRRLALREYDHFLRRDVDPPALGALQRLCEQADESPLDWGYRDKVHARNHVGVLRVPGLTIEILPKIDDAPGARRCLPVGGAGAATSGASAADVPAQALARGNLLYMLSVAGTLPLAEVDLARLDARRFPLWELFALLFAKRLLRELRRGVEHDYVEREENLRYLRGCTRTACWPLRARGRWSCRPSPTPMART